ncbi:hypothetical protein DFH09DRAFT_922363 [Mycena vulgaris]|nr:hypothetical protein DFH09DRAFT_922363 [Mycena vulgaris]
MGPGSAPEATPPPPNLVPANWDVAIPALPESALEWFAHAYKAITKESLGSEFNELIGVLIQTEGAYGYANGGRALPANSRPKEITTWIGSRRGRCGGSGANGPTFPTATSATVNVFGEVWGSWWKGLQPAWRAHGVRQTGLMYAKTVADWGQLRCPGPNGLFVVVLGLYWWGREKKMSRLSRDAWVDGVADEKWVLTCLEEAERRKAEADVRKLGDTDHETDQLPSE